MRGMLVYLDLGFSVSVGDPRGAQHHELTRE
jgi:hypothetical protein